MARTEPNISRNALFEQLEYTPHSDGQREAHYSDARFRTACCGRRWGKSVWAGKELTYKMFVPESINWIVSPEYSVGEKEFRVVWKDFEKLGLLKRCKRMYNVKQGNMLIHFKDLDSLLEVKSEQRPTSLVGEKLDHVTFSEAAKLNRSTWEMYVRPALQDVRGSADFPSTPEGFNWYEGLFRLGQDPEYTDYESWRFPSWTNAIVFPGGREDPEILEVEKRVSPQYFAQEIGAEFTSFEGMIYPEFSEKTHVKEFDYNPAWRNWWALDFGFVDPFVCLDIMIDQSQRVWVWREYQVSYLSTTEHGQTLKARDNPDGFHVDGIAADPRGADEAATLAWIIGTMNQNSISWEGGIETVRRHMKMRDDGMPGIIIHPNCKHLIRQLKNLRAKKTGEDKNQRPGQHDYDDHGPDALRYFFVEYFFLGGDSSLKDIYNRRYVGSEAESFFKYETGLKLGSGPW